MSGKKKINATELLDLLEAMAREYCGIVVHRGVIGGTESNTEYGLSRVNASALRALAKHGRFRITRDGEGEVAGYWPEDDPDKKG